ncbi:MAG: aldo/keto reductase [Oscillospiraceae bacterium]|nr:aldo/keto reductase [Oscillospiraceae bacterium]MBQ9939605.1 aldo/keto reductase [Oscillospiraceae bacterium]
MRYKRFGKTELQVSEMCLGTWGIGGAGWDSNSEETRLDAIYAAVEAGINFIDTAPAYNNGEAERMLGRALKNMGKRHEVVISTKCGNFFNDGVNYIRDCSRDKIIQQIDDSLRNLQTDYIDIMLIHWPDPKTPFEETMGILSDLKKAGKILHVGVSNFSREQMEEVDRYCTIEAYQPQYSMVSRGNEAQIKWAAEKDIGVMTYGSLGGGILTGAIREVKEYAPSDSRNRFYKHFQEPTFSKIMEVVKVMDRISAEHDNVPLSQIAINWCAQKEFISTCIVGSQQRRKIFENVAAFDWSLSADEMAMLDEAIHTYLD